MNSCCLLFTLFCIGLSSRIPEDPKAHVADKITVPALKKLSNEFGSCPKKGSCLKSPDILWNRTVGNDGQKLVRDLLSERNCFCDQMCGYYSDCCHDYPGRKFDTLERGTFECVFQRDLNARFGYDASYDIHSFYLVTRCPSTWEINVTRELCEDGAHRAGASMVSPIHTWPVSSLRTKVMFKNVYCATCHGVSEYAFWRMSYGVVVSPLVPILMHNLSSVGEPTIIPTRLTLQQLLSRNGSVVFYPPAHLSGLHAQPFCTKFVDVPCEDPVLEKPCKEGPFELTYGRRFVRFPQLYRNKYCAMCDNAFITCAPPVGVPPPSLSRQMPSYSILLDLNTHSARLNTMGKDSKGYALKRCEDGTVYDPFTNECLVGACGRLYRYVDGKCLRLRNGTSRYNATSGKTVLLHDCQTKRLTTSEFILFNNGTALMNKTGVLLRPGEFEIESGGLRVCVSASGSVTGAKEVFNATTLPSTTDLKGVLTAVGLLLSMLGLVALLVVYSLLPSLRNLSGKCLMCMCASLLIAQLLFFVGLPRTEVRAVCVVLGATMHYFYLATFCWKLVLAFDFARTFAKIGVGHETARRFGGYFAFAATAPACIVAAALLLDFLPNLPIDDAYKPSYGKRACWITQRWALIYSFIVPIGTILLANMVFYAVTVAGICRKTGKRLGKNQISHATTLIIYVKLSSVLGLPWLLGLTASASNVEALWYLFIIANSSQGVFISMTFLCRSQVLTELRNSLSPVKQKLLACVKFAQTESTNPNNYNRVHGKSCRSNAGQIPELIADYSVCKVVSSKGGYDATTESRSSEQVLDTALTEEWSKLTSQLTAVKCESTRL